MSILACVYYVYACRLIQCIIEADSHVMIFDAFIKARLPVWVVSTWIRQQRKISYKNMFKSDCVIDFLFVFVGGVFVRADRQLLLKTFKCLLIAATTRVV